MNKIVFIHIIISFFVLTQVQAQTEKLVKKCNTYFTDEYTSDGQHYMAKLKFDEPLEFSATFFGGTTYRIAAASDIPKTKLEISIYDSERNLLYNNKKYNYTESWDFKFNSTVECIIEIKVIQEKFTQGFVLLLIGFKDELK